MKAKLGLAIGSGGVIAISWPGLTSPDASNYLLGAAGIALAVTGTGVGNVAMKRLAGEADPIMAVGFGLAIGAGPLAVSSLMTEGAISWSPQFLIVLLVLSVFGTALAFWLWFSVLARVDLGRANAFTFLVPLFGLAIGAGLFGERFGLLQAFGIALILTSVVLVQHNFGGPESHEGEAKRAWAES